MALFVGGRAKTRSSSFSPTGRSIRNRLAPPSFASASLFSVILAVTSWCFCLLLTGSEGKEPATTPAIATPNGKAVKEQQQEEGVAKKKELQESLKEEEEDPDDLQEGGEKLSVKKVLDEAAFMLRELSGKVERSYLTGLSADGEYEATCPEVLHKCGFDPETQAPEDFSFAPEGLEQSEVFNQEVSFEAATVYVTRTADRNGPGVRSLRCTSDLLERDYTRFWRKQGSPKERYVQQYFADQQTGALVQYPARAWVPNGPDGGRRYESRCAGEGDYDVRKRNWYTQRVTGPKDIVLVLDTSGSMKNHGRAELVLAAAKQVLESLDESDLASVVTFANTAEMLKPPQPMTPEWKEELLLWLEDTVFVGQTNFEAGLQLAFDALRQSQNLERGSTLARNAGLPLQAKAPNCAKLILFLTDGHQTVGKTPAELIPKFQEWNEGLDARLLTYSFGAEAAQEACRDLACALDGIWWHVEDGGDLSGAMSSYYKLLAVSESDNPEDRKVMFQYYPYDLAGGFDLGACAAAFDRTQTPHMLLGLSCMSAMMIADVRALRNASDFNATLLEAGLENLRCSTAKLSPSDMQRMRRRISGGLAVCGSEWRKDQTTGFLEQRSGKEEGGDESADSGPARALPALRSSTGVLFVLLVSVSNLLLRSPKEARC